MGQVASLPEGGQEKRKPSVEGGNFTDIGGNQEGDESSFDSLLESAQATSVDFEKGGDKGNHSIISSNLEIEKPARRNLLQPSSPSEWIDAFRTSTDEELISLLEEGISLESDQSIAFRDLTPLCTELRCVASSIQKYRAFQKTMGLKMEASPDTNLSKKHSNSSAGCFYNLRSSSQNSSQNTYIENDTDIIDLCKRILEASSSRASHNIHRKNIRKSNNEKTTRKPMLTLSRVRQKLVPSKLKEHIFWESLWVLLFERKKARQQQDLFARIKNSTNDFNANNHQNYAEENSYNKNRIAFLEEQLRNARRCISGLVVQYNAETREREEMEKVIEQMWEMIPRNLEGANLSQNASVNTLESNHTRLVKTGSHNRDNTVLISEKENDKTITSVNITTNAEKSSSTTTQHSPCHHTGTWIMTKDSIEFLAYPSEAKEALRAEKQKRLKRVTEEMAFILDSDHPKDSHGEWSCCNKTDFNAVCGSAVAE